MTLFGEGDGALGRTKRMICFLKIAATALSVDTFIDYIY